MIRKILPFAVLAGSLALVGCGTNTKGSWACQAAEGSSCASIAQIDSLEGPPAEGKHRRKPAPIVDGAGAVRWWTQEDARAGELANGPRRETDQVIKITIAPWIDAIGDYHDLSDVFGVMRKGGWWTSPPISPLAPAVVSRPLPPPPPPPPPPESSALETSPVANGAATSADVGKKG